MLKAEKEATCTIAVSCTDAVNQFYCHIVLAVYMPYSHVSCLSTKKRICKSCTVKCSAWCTLNVPLAAALVKSVESQAAFVDRVSCCILWI